MRWLKAVVVGGGLLLGCGSEVVIDDGVGEGFGGDEAARDRERNRGAGSNGAGSGTPPPCIRCGDGDCGWCAHEGGDVAYRCATDVAPRSDMQCDATGNLFVDPADGSHYVCWRCFD